MSFLQNATTGLFLVVAYGPMSCSNGITAQDAQAVAAKITALTEKALPSFKEKSSLYTKDKSTSIAFVYPDIQTDSPQQTPHSKSNSQIPQHATIPIKNGVQFRKVLPGPYQMGSKMGPNCPSMQNFGTPPHLPRLYA